MTQGQLTRVAIVPRHVVMLERRRAGIAKAKADGKYKGRKPPQWPRPTR
jgi:hypothetical protein